MEGVDDVIYSPVPCLCSGIVTSKIKDKETYEVVIHDSPIGELNGPIYATLIYPPGLDGNIKQGTKVKVMMTFSFGGTDNKFLDVFPGTANHIMGSYNERSVANIEVENPHTEQDNDNIRYVHDYSGAGLVTTKSGKTWMSGGPLYSMLNPGGFGINENFHRNMAQNHHRIISHNGPFYLSKEHFGLYAGSKEDRPARVGPDDFSMIYRRFVTQTKSGENWVSTCEGTSNPWFGGNNDFDSVSKGKDVLLSKIINNGKSRATIEIGQPGTITNPGTDFINVRIDDIIQNEQKVPGFDEVSPAIIGNRFKMQVSAKGELDIRSAGKGTPGANLNGFHMSVDSSGNLTIHASGSVEVSHGDADVGINSIKMDPTSGIDITAKNGFRVNGSPVVNQKFLDWMKKYQSQLCLATSIGGPAPINPIALPEFTNGTVNIDDLGGFTTDNKGVPATKIIQDIDDFSTV